MSGSVLAFCRDHFRFTRYPCVYTAKMKKEIAAIEKILRRKQRMFLIMCKEHVVMHKYFFSKQNKRLRGFQEIAHGESWFYGAVHRFAQELNKHDQVVSEDDEFWDKNFLIQEDIYYIQKRALKRSVNLSEEDDRFLDVVSFNCSECIVVLPTGDIVVLTDVNPSGKDGTTETNCIGRCLIEAYMQVLYFKHIEKPLSYRDVAYHKKGTKYLGDDRIAGSRDYAAGYFDFYRANVHRVGVILKTYAVTEGAVGAEFAGFTVQRSNWDPNYFVPHYKVDKIWVSLFARPYETFDILMSRFMAFAVLLYPQYDLFKRLQPVVVTFLQSREEESTLLPIALRFWGDEKAIRRMWTGHEAGGGGGIKECQPFNQDELEHCLTQCLLIDKSPNRGWIG